MDIIIKAKVRHSLIFALLILLFVLVFFFCVGFGSVQISLLEVMDIVFRGNEENKIFYKIIWNIRMPRALGALIGGSALAVAGLMLQVFFRNPIVEPFVLGVSSGASLCVALVIMGGVTLGFASVSPTVIFLAAFIGSLVVMGIVLLFASRVKSVITLLVIGLMVGYAGSAITSVLIAFADKEQLQGFTMWTLGSFSGFTWNSIRILLLVGIPSLFATLLIVKPLNAFLLGEEYAISMGVNIQAFRVVIVFLSSLLAAVVTAFAGPVGFIGLAVPHLTRLLFKTSDNRLLIPGTILMGGIVTSLCDLIARTIFAPVELPISAVTALIGAPIVIFLIVKRRTSI